MPCPLSKSTSMSNMLPYRNRLLYRQTPRQAASAGGSARTSFTPQPATSYKSTREQVELAIDLLYRRKWIIIVCFVLAVAGVAWYTFPTVDEYEAHSFILVELASGPGGRSSSGVATTDMLPATDNLFAQANRSVSEELLLLQISSPLALRVAERLQEIKVIPQTGEPISFLRGSTRERTTDEVANIIRRYVSFSPERGSINVIRVTAQSTIPGEAVLLANVFAEEYEKMTAEASKSRSAESWAFLKEQEQQRRDELAEIEARISAYIADAGGVGLSDSDRGLVSEIAGMEATRDDLQMEYDQRQANLRKLEQQIEDLSGRLPQAVVSNPEQQIQEIRKRIVQQKQQKEQIEARNPMPGRSEVVRRELQRRDSLIADLEAQLQRMSESYVDQLASTGGVSGADGGAAYLAALTQRVEAERQELEVLQGRLNLLGERIEKRRSDLARIPGRSAYLAELERSRAYAEQMYQFVAQRVLEERLTGAAGRNGGYVRVLQKAGYPIPLPSDAYRNLILGAFLGLLAGLGLAIVRDKLDNRLYKLDQVQDMGQTTLGAIPDMTPLIRKAARNGKTVRYEGLKLAPSLAVSLDRSSIAAGVYRPLRVNLGFTSSGKRPKTIVVTSPGVGDGKSLSAANLALATATAGSRTLLIDADLHRPRVQELFGFRSDPGLIDILKGEASFRSEHTVTDISDLHILTSGGTAWEGPELLGSDKMQALLKELEAQFDVIVIDTPPTLAVTDALVLAATADATVVVARAGKTKEKELTHCMDLLTRVGANVAGTVLNGFDVSMAFGYKYRYEDYSSYGAYAKYGYGVQRSDENATAVA